MKKLSLASLFAVLALGLVAAAYPLAKGNPKAKQGDCPGKVICPLSGEEVCKDRCPLAAEAEESDTTRADCPGQVECPLTGQLACRDQCLASAAKAAGATAVAPEAQGELPPCCRKN